MTLGYTSAGSSARSRSEVAAGARGRARRTSRSSGPFELAGRSALGLVLFAALGTVVGIYAETWDHTTFIQNIVILPLAFVGGVFYSVELLPSPVGGAVSLQPRLLPRQRRALRLPRRERRQRLALARGHRGARDPGLPVGAVPVQHRQALEGARAPRRARSSLPPLPAAGRVARAGGAREARGVRGRGLLGPAGARASATRRAACTCSASPRRRTAATAPGGCSPATAPATGCSARCTAPASPTSRRRVSRDDGLRLRGRLGRRRRALRPAGQQADARASATPACPTRAEELEPDRPARDRLPGRLRLGRRLPAARAAAPQAALRPRRRAPRRGRRRCCSAATTRASRTPSPAA